MLIQQVTVVLHVPKSSRLGLVKRVLRSWGNLRLSNFRRFLSGVIHRLLQAASQTDRHTKEGQGNAPQRVNCLLDHEISQYEKSRSANHSSVACCENKLQATVPLRTSRSACWFAQNPQLAEKR